MWFLSEFWAFTNKYSIIFVYTVGDYYEIKKIFTFTTIVYINADFS